MSILFVACEVVANCLILDTSTNHLPLENNLN